MDYEKLKEVIAKQIKENGRREITGPVLQAVLMAMVDSLGEAYPQTYTDEQKAQARANIDALSDHNGAITEPKLDTALTAKVNNNVKTVEQTLTDDEINIVSKNLKFRDDNGNVFLNSPFINFEGNNVRDNLICYSEHNEFTEYGGNSSNTILFSINNSFGDDFQGNLCLFASNNNFGSDVVHDNVFGPCFDQNEIWGDLYNSVFGSGCVGNYIKGGYSYLKFDSGVSFVELANNSLNIANHIHVLSGVKGKSNTERLIINIPDEYLGSSRELIITTKVTNGGPSNPEDIVMYYADEVVDKQNKQDTTLETTSKEVVGAINEVYKGGLEDASIATSKIKDGAITEPKLDTDLVNVITSAVQPAELASAIANALASYVAKEDIVDTTGSATDKVMSQHGVTEVINGVTNKVTELAQEVNGKQDDIDSLSTDEKNALLVSLGLGKIGVVSQKQTWNDVGVEPAYVMSEKVKGFISQDDIDILTSYGFVFNEETGYFELNGLTDISLQEALDIVAVGKPNFSLCDLHYAYKKIRTNLPVFDNQNYNVAYFGNGIANKIRIGAMAYNSDMEVFVYGQYKYDNNYKSSGFLYSTIEQGGLAFNHCSKLEKISIIPGTSTRFFETFTGCSRLKELELVYLMCDVNFGQSSLLSAKSIHIMIANANNTAAITITLHSDAKARWESSEYYEADSQTIINKNITIA